MYDYESKEIIPTPWSVHEKANLSWIYQTGLLILLKY